MDIINLTPHAITLILQNQTLTFEPSGTVARVSASVETISHIGDIPVTKTTFGQVENLPDPSNGTVYLVSSLVAQAVKERTDVFIPNESVRDEAGRIIGCKSLGRLQ